MVSHHAEEIVRHRAMPQRAHLKTPKSVAMTRNRNSLSIQWSNQLTSLISIDALLAHYSGKNDSTGNKLRPTELKPVARIKSIMALGEVGLHITLENSHTESIFPWTYLYRLTFEDLRRSSGSMV